MRLQTLCFAFALAAVARVAGAEEQAIATPVATAEPGLDFLSKLLETEVTSVSRHAERASEAPASVSVITAEEIRQHGFRTIAEAIRLIPGVFVHSDRAFEYVGIRGFGLLGDYNTRVLILLDGHALNTQLAYAQSYLGGDMPIDLSAVERIEVIKGPASATYGPSAFFGVINIVTRKGVDVEGTLFSGRVDSNFRRAGAMVSGRRFANGLDLVASLRGLDAPGLTYDFEERGGVTQGTDYERAKSIYGRLSWKDFSFAFDGLQRVKGLPTAPYAAEFGSDITRYENQQWFALASWTHAFAAGVDVQATLRANEFAVDDFFEYPDLMFFDVAREKWQSAEVSADYSPLAGTRIQTGATGTWHRASVHSFDDIDDIDTGYRTTFDTQLAYAEAEQRLLSDRLRVTAGATVFRHSLMGSRVTPRTGLVAKPLQATTLKVLYGEGFRTPNLNERFFDDGYYFAANPNVRPESVRTLESSVEQVFFGRARLTVAAHRDWYEGLIHEHEFTGDDGVRAQWQNDAPASSWGTETSIQAGLGSGWSIRAGHAWSRANTAHGEEPLNFPQHILNGGIRGPIAPQTFLALDASWVDRRRRELTDDEAAADPDAIRRVPPAFLLNASVRTEGWGEHVGLLVGVRNILNRRMTDPVVADHKPIVQVDQEPRTLHIAIDYRF